VVDVEELRRRCVADHPSLHVRAIGGIEQGDDGRVHFREPEVGQPLVFYPKGLRGVVTSPVLDPWAEKRHRAEFPAARRTPLALN
jgi:hypothetical protein